MRYSGPSTRQPLNELVYRYWLGLPWVWLLNGMDDWTRKRYSFSRKEKWITNNKTHWSLALLSNFWSSSLKWGFWKQTKFQIIYFQCKSYVTLHCSKQTHIICLKTIFLNFFRLRYTLLCLLWQQLKSLWAN